MAWKSLDATDYKGIRVTFKDGKTEDFLHSHGIKFSAQVWRAEMLVDKTDGKMNVGYWDSDGDWEYWAEFPAGSYAFVRIIMYGEE